MASKKPKSSKDDVNEQYTVSVNIPRDGSCLFWAVTLAFLTPVLDNRVLFNKRLKKLFPEIVFNDFCEICEFFKDYNPSDFNQNVKTNIIFSDLVTKQLRSRVIEHMKSQREKYKKLIQDEIKSEISLKDETCESYLTRMVTKVFTALI